MSPDASANAADMSPPASTADAAASPNAASAVAGISDSASSTSAWTFDIASATPDSSDSPNGDVSARTSMNASPSESATTTSGG